MLQTDGSSSGRGMYMQDDMTALTIFSHIIPLTV